MPVTTLHSRVLAALMAALTAVGAYVALPVGPVPIILATVFVLLAGMLLGSRTGATSMGVYLALGLMGLPVFSLGRGGIAHFMGPTGGYLIGYVLAAYVAGFIAERAGGTLFGDILAATLGTAAIFALGLPWLRFHPTLNLEWGGTLAFGMLPYLPGAVIKVALAVTLARYARPMVSSTRELGLQ